MKNIFIVISEAILIRNIMRSGTLEWLKKKGHNLYIFIACEEIPEYLKEEFKDERVRLIPLDINKLKVGRIHKRLILLTHFLILNDTTRVYFSVSRHYLGKSRAVIFFYQLALNILSRLPLLKRGIRWLEKTLFPERHESVEHYFDSYQPDLVFSTSITSRIDNIFLKAAKRRGVTSVSMTKSWDNATKMYYRFVPDYFLVQNRIIKDHLARLQDFPRKNIYPVGFPQFDWYAKKEYFVSREEHLKKKGLDPDKPLIFFGSQGPWYKHDHEIAEQIYTWVKEDALAVPAQMIVRPHFKNVKNSRLSEMKGREKLAFDDSYHVSNDFVDNWDPQTASIIDFMNTIRHSDVIVMMLSTLALDGSCFDTPIINTLYGGTFRGDEDVTAKLAKVVHYQWIFRTGGTTVVRNTDELKDAINTYLTNSDHKSDGRARIVRDLCFGADGNSSDRIVDALERVLRDNTSL